MTTSILGPDINSSVSFDPLIRFWEEHLAAAGSPMAGLFKKIRDQIRDIPGLSGDIEDIGVINEHYDLVSFLMAAVFPAATFKNDILGALLPCSLEPFFASPEFQRIFIDNSAFVTALLENLQKKKVIQKRLQILHLILERFYGLSFGPIQSLDIREVPDQDTGLIRYYGITTNFSFVDIIPLEAPRPLSGADRALILDNPTDLDLLSKHIDLSRFKFSGFTLVRATDVTDSQVISALERDLIEQRAIFSTQGITLLEQRIRTLLRRQDIFLALGATLGGRVMMIKNDESSAPNCFFSKATYNRIEDLEGSIWLKSAREGTPLRIPDLAAKKDPVAAEKESVAAGVRSILLFPLYDRGEPIGILEIFAHTPNALGAMDALVVEQVVPLFSVALKRGLDDMGKQIQAVIKEKCTAVHPSVEWRFEEAAFNHMERLRFGDTASEMEPIIFKGVVPFYGQSDIRGSSRARNEAIQTDLSRQLTLALAILAECEKKRHWPIIREFRFRVEGLLKKIKTELTPADEHQVITLLNTDIAQAFGDLKGIGTEVAREIDAYQRTLNPESGLIYDRRREYEESVFRLNQSLSRFLDMEDAKVQKNFPHYFEKRQTDGVDYMMYIGASMTQEGRLASFHIQDMTLWQLGLACGLARRAALLRPGLQVPLEACHLILVNHAPLSIRFRFDEKRFDVDGAYDARNEIIKSRLDKALVKGTGQRLTQPGQIAVVYATEEEGQQISRHVEFLTTRGIVESGMEMLTLDDLPSVQGLRAIRFKASVSIP